MALTQGALGEATAEEEETEEAMLDEEEDGIGEEDEEDEMTLLLELADELVEMDDEEDADWLGRHFDATAPSTANRLKAKSCRKAFMFPWLKNSLERK